MSISKALGRPPNHILSYLPQPEYKRLAAHLEPVSFPLGATLYRPGEETRYVHFINSGMVSLLITLAGGESVEVGLIGDEGVLGVHYALGSEVSSLLAIAQIPVDSLRMDAAVFRSEFNRAAALREQLLKYTNSQLFMISQTVACNRIHVLAKRLARWMLMVHDRAHSDQFPMTHEFISRMLGTTRAEISKAAAMLKRQGLIRYDYGKITILDRRKLESASCECYRAVKEAYEIPLDGKGKGVDGKGIRKKS